MGDWDGDGNDSPGVNVGGNRFILGDAYDHRSDYDFYYGVSGDVPLVGDWNGDAKDTVAIRRDHCFHWRNDLAGGSADNVTCFGNVNDKAVVGDWDGNGTDTPGVVRDGVWWLSNGFDGSVWRSFGYGSASDQPLVGDWDGNGSDTPGLLRGNTFLLSNDFSGTVHHSLAYGNAGDFGVTGDWNPMPDALDDEPVDYMNGGGGLSGTLSPSHPVVRYAPLVYLNELAGAPHYPGRFPNSARTVLREHAELGWWDRDATYHQLAGRRQLRNLIHLGDNRTGFFDVWSSASAAQTTFRYSPADYTRPYGEDYPRPAGLSRTAGFVLDFDDETRAGNRALQQVPVYYDYVERRYITYWFFFPYNDTQGGTYGVLTHFQHEGDWERIAVRLDSQNRAEEADVFFYRHGGACGVSRRYDYLEEDPLGSGHPVIYSARGTHGSYSRAGTHSTDCVSSVTPDDETARGTRWETWKGPLADVRKQPWYGFGGAWGRVGITPGQQQHTTGPVGPSRWKPPAPEGWMAQTGSSGNGPDFGAYASAVLADAPTAYWRLGEPGVGPVEDLSGNGHHGVRRNQLVIGETGALNDVNMSNWLDGVDDYIHSEAKSTLVLGNDLTIEAWVKPNVVTGPAVRQTIYGHGNAANQPQLELGGTGGRNRVSVIVPSTFIAETTDDAVVPGVWQHVVYTRSGPGSNHHIYVNGIEKPLVLNSTTNYVDAFSTKLLGARVPTLQRFQGGLDEVAVYTSALSADRVLAHYRAGVSPYAQAVLADRPLAYWRLGEFAGTRATDVSRNGHHASYISDVRLGGAGAVNDFDGSAEFDGIDDVVQANAESTFAVGNTISVEAWIKPAAAIGAARQTIYGRNNSSDHPMFQFGGFAGTNRLCVVIPSGIMAETADNAVTPGEWQHVVYTRSGPGATHRIYVNGVERPLVTNATTTYVDSPSAKLIGGRNTTTARFQGAIDEVAVYATALTSQQISQHYEASGR